MSELLFEFNRKKALEAILYLSNRASESTLHSITHLLYFADKTSLERYARFICGDDYFAMEHGPIPTNTYNILKSAEWDEDLPIETAGHQVRAKREPQLDELSESDIECLDIALDLYGDAPFWKRKYDSHDEAYDEAWESREGKGSVRIPIENIAALLEDSHELLNFLQNRHSR